eukprot:207484_1
MECNGIMYQTMFSTIITATLFYGSSSGLTWRQGSTYTSLLDTKSAAFTAKWNNKIYVLGGQDTGTDLIEYDAKTFTFKSIDNDFDFGFQHSMSSTQHEHLLYMMPYSSMNINIFNLSSLSIIDTITSYARPANQGRCLVYHNNFLHVVGGNNGNTYYKDHTLYDLQNQIWITSTPVDISGQGIGYVACSVVNHVLYLIGGWIPWTNSNRIRTIDISNSTSMQAGWTQWPAPYLSSIKSSHRSVVWGHLIYVIGGLNSYGCDVVDTVNQQVYKDSDIMYTVQRQSLFIYKNTIYCLAAYPTGNNNNYQYTDIPTTAPTPNPTETPTFVPTPNPTNLPTFQPTLNPSTNPSIDPTNEPTSNPSYNPTVIPSMEPTDNPTLNPLLNPTMRPSMEQTKNPTIRPIKRSTTLTLISTEKVTFTTPQKQNTFLIILIVVIVVVVYVCCILACLYIERRKQLYSLKKSVDVIEHGNVYDHAEIEMNINEEEEKAENNDDGHKVTSGFSDDLSSSSSELFPQEANITETGDHKLSNNPTKNIPLQFVKPLRLVNQPLSESHNSMYQEDYEGATKGDELVTNSTADVGAV